MTSHAIYILKIHNKYRVRLCEQWLFTNGQSNQGGGGTNCEMERDYTSLLGSDFKNTTFFLSVFFNNFLYQQGGKSRINCCVTVYIWMMRI